jgi:choline-glycine betaine transporter
MTLANRQKTTLIIGSIVSLVIIVVVYSVYQQISRDENARLAHVKQEGILYDKHKQQCRDIGSDLSARIQEFNHQEKNRSDQVDFENEVQARRNALMAEASQLLNQCPHWIIEEVDRQIAQFTSPQ